MADKRCCFFILSLHFDAMNKGLALMVVAIVATGALVPLFVNLDNSADMIIYGEIYTEDGIQEVVAIRDGKIVYVGSETGVHSYYGIHTKIIDVGNNFVMPGFVDSHAHPYKYFEGKDCGIDLTDVENLTTEEDLLQRISDYVAAHTEDEEYYGYGWQSEVFTSSGDQPSAEQLDDVTTKPICLESANCHEMWCNTAFLEKANITKDTPDVEGGVIERDADGNPTGWFKEAAIDTYIKPYLVEFTEEQYRQVVLDTQDYYLSLGYTSYVETILNWNGHDHLLQAYEKLDREGLLKINVRGGWMIQNNENTMEDVEKAAELVEYTKGGKFEVNTVKFFLDGVVEGHTALLTEEYEDSEAYYGTSAWKENVDGLNQAVAKANELGLIAHFHAIGDAAVQMAIDATKYSEQQGCNNGHNVITHMQLFSDEQAEEMYELGMVAASNLSWGLKFPFAYDTEVAYLGEERASHEYPIKHLVDNNVPFGFATDWPAGFDVSPFVGMEVAVTRTSGGDPDMVLGIENAISREKALSVMTYGGAYQMCMNTKGLIKVGMDADLIVVDHNLLTCSISELSASQNLMTMINGEILYCAEAW